MRPPPRGVSDVFEPELATVPGPEGEPVLDPGVFDVELLPVPSVLPFEPVLAVEVLPVELRPAPVVFVVVEPALAFEVFDVDVLPVVVVVLEPVLVVDVFEVE